jgi:DNA-binding MarR family transcriptional regulator
MAFPPDELKDAMDDRSANLVAALAVALYDEVAGSLADADLPGPSAAAALTTLRAFPDDGIDALSRVVGLTVSGTVRLVAGLVDDGLVSKRPGRDGRSVALRLTDAGHRQARRVLASRRHRMEGAVTSLNAAEQRAFVRLAEKLLAGLTTDRLDADRICRLCDDAACPDRRCPVELAIAE